MCFNRVPHSPNDNTMWNTSTTTTDFLPEDGLQYLSSPDLSRQDSLTENYLIYAGEEDFIEVINLKPDTEYQVRIYEFNSDERGNTTYQLENPAQISFQAGMAQCNEEASLDLSQNPMRESSRLIVTAPEGFIKAQLILSDMMGQSLMEVALDQNTFDLYKNDMESGLYLLQVKINDRWRLVERLVVE